MSSCTLLFPYSTHFALDADGNTGLCNCFDGYMSSNGYGGPGRRGDCGALAMRALRIPALP